MTQERHATNKQRQYIPPIDSRVWLKSLSHCLVVTGDYDWHVLIAKRVNMESETVTCELASTANKSRDGELVTVPFSAINPPVGWHAEGYTIHVEPSKVNDVLSWLSRGIVVRFSQYIGDGSTAFQPLDNSAQPHWKYGEITDTISPEDTRELIRVVKLESVYDARIPCECQYCNGTGIHTTNKALEAQDTSTEHCAHCGAHLGFSFRERWHSSNSQYDSIVNPTGNCARTRNAGECWVCNGTGKGMRYLSEMEPKRERKQAIEQLERDNWRVWYQKRGKMWRMERETVVKEFGQEVSTCQE